MESTPKNELGNLSDNKREIITQAFAEVCENVPSTEQDWDTTNESKDLLEINQNSRYQRPEISDDSDFNITDKCSQQTADERTADEKTAEERTADERTADEKTAEERTADERTADERTADERTADERTADESHGRTAHCYLIQDDLQEFREKLLDEELERSNVVDFETKTCELICEGDPKEKALRYLEESGVLRMFQNLAAGIVHDRPQQPLLYMMKALEQAKDEDWGELPDFGTENGQNGKIFETIK